MKFEQISKWLKILIWKLNFQITFFSARVIAALNKYFFSWKISNYADSYWFMYSNKKFFYEKKSIF